MNIFHDLPKEVNLISYGGKSSLFIIYSAIDHIIYLLVIGAWPCHAGFEPHICQANHLPVVRMHNGSWCLCISKKYIKALRTRQNDWILASDIVKCMSVRGNACISFRYHWSLFLRVQLIRRQSLVQELHANQATSHYSVIITQFTNVYIHHMASVFLLALDSSNRIFWIKSLLAGTFLTTILTGNQQLPDNLKSYQKIIISFS